MYNMMRAVSKFCPIYTLAVGNAFGEAALLLAAGSPVSDSYFSPSMLLARHAWWQLVTSIVHWSCCC